MPNTYSLSGTLYGIIPNALRTSNALNTQQPGVHADGIISATSGSTIKQPSRHIAQLCVDPPTQSAAQKPSSKNKKNNKNTTCWDGVHRGRMELISYFFVYNFVKDVKSP